MKINFVTKEKIDKEKITLKAVFENQENLHYVKKEELSISYFFPKKEAVIFLGKQTQCDFEKIILIAKEIVSKNLRGFNLDVTSFENKHLKEEQLVDLFTTYLNIYGYQLWNKKKTEKNKLTNKDINLVVSDARLKVVFLKSQMVVNNINQFRDFQTMPHNWLNSEIYAKSLKAIFNSYKDVKMKILGKKEALQEQMGLFLAVNKGSAYEPQCVVLTYQGDPENKDHFGLVGKGITFDSGGMNVKPGRYMEHMKMDMAGSAVVAAVLKTVADLKLKVNVSAILMCTDNMISSYASKPDDVVIASNGLSIEINNTDAEGRLVMADGLVYAWKKLKTTKIVDVATLTGAIVYSLGDTYTGVWSTCEKEWQKFNKASQKAYELVWRMPLHKDYLKFMKASKVADLRNTDYTGNGGSSSAAMFLKEFTNKIPYIHLDIAGSAGDEFATGIMIKTIVNYLTEK